MSYIHESASVVNCDMGAVKIVRNAAVKDSILPDGCSIGDDSTVERCKFENNVVINRRCYVNDSYIGKYTYMGINTTMNFTKIGRFCSLARNVDIGGFDHDYHKVTTMPAFRFAQLLNGGGKLVNRTEHRELCKIGNDVWIAAGAQILHKVKIGDGAVIGGGAVVTKDVPPYAIVVGVPAKVIGYRCAPENIEALEEIQWWNWPETLLAQVVPQLIEKDISNEVIEDLKQIASSLKEKKK